MLIYQFSKLFFFSFYDSLSLSEYIYIYICVCVCVCLSVCVCVCVWVGVCFCACVLVSLKIAWSKIDQVLLCQYINHIHTHAHTHRYIYICIYITFIKITDLMTISGQWADKVISVENESWCSKSVTVYQPVLSSNNNDRTFSRNAFFIKKL